MEKRRPKKGGRDLHRRGKPNQLHPSQLRPPDSVLQQANIRLYEATERRVQREGEALMTQLRIEMEQRNIIYQLASFCVSIKVYANARKDTLQTTVPIRVSSRMKGFWGGYLPLPPPPIQRYRII